MDAVLEGLRRASRVALLPPEASILLAISGGADSMALLQGCLEVARETGWRLSVGHVHHGLRGREADRDLAFVREHARRANLPFHFRRRDAGAAARSLRISPEAAARTVRYEALHEMARQARASLIAVAHQKGDVAESVLLALRRRAGVSALAGPRERRGDGVVRPLLGVRREEILSFLEARGIGYRRDASNGDLRFDRNRARRDLARRGSSHAAVDALARTAAASTLERDRIEREFEELVRPRLLRGPDDVVLADAAWLAACPRELARRALAEAAAPFAALGHPGFTGRERERLLDLLVSGSDFRFEAGRRIRVERRAGLLRVAPRLPAGSGQSSRV